MDSPEQVTFAGAVGMEPPAPALAVCMDAVDPAVLAADAPAAALLPVMAMADVLGVPEDIVGAAAVDPAAPAGFVMFGIVALEPIAGTFVDAGAAAPLVPDAVAAGTDMLGAPFDVPGAALPSACIAALPQAAAPSATSAAAA